MTLRPGKRAEVRGLPWTGKPSETYALLEDLIGASRRGQVLYDRQTKAFSVARSHAVELINGLAATYGQVHVIQYGGVEKCVEACWNARPETAIDCECSCAGANHGSQRPVGRIVAEGAGGALSVAALSPREWDVFG